MSQLDLARRSGVSNAEISRIESGLREAPHPHTLQKLAAVLGVEAEELYRAAGYLQGEPSPALGETGFKAIGLRLRTARELAGLSLEDLAKRIGAEPADLKKWEEGGECEQVFAERVAKVLRVPFDGLTGGEPYPQTTQQLVDRAFEYIKSDPEYRFGGVRIDDLEFKKSIVRMYERARGVKLLPDHIA
jgi:transcriptional regulator with XRE-family HTH domain